MSYPPPGTQTVATATAARRRRRRRRRDDDDDDDPCRHRYSYRRLRSTPPPLRTSGDSPHSKLLHPFTSWDDLLNRTVTRTGTALSSIPAFVDFCRRHEYLAARLGGGGDGDGDIEDGEGGEGQGQGRARTATAMIRNQLQGGRGAGPIATTRAGQSVRAGSYYPGLTAIPRHPLPKPLDDDDGTTTQTTMMPRSYRHDDLAWVNVLQLRMPEIRDEFFNALPSLPPQAWESLRTRRGKEWSDGTGWAHVALVDNFRRNDAVVSRFPATARILDDVVGTGRRIGPRLVAFARQEGRSGIPTHCDYMNWMLTLHTALGGRTAGGASGGGGGGGGAGMVVDGVRRDWTVDDPIVMDTTFAHSTYNDNVEDTYLLLVDFWHPDLSLDEIDALRTFFAANSAV